MRIHKEVIRFFLAAVVSLRDLEAHKAQITQELERVQKELDERKRQQAHVSNCLLHSLS